MQIKNRFDIVTKNKILKGAMIAMGGACAIAGLEYFNTVEFSNPALTAFMVWFVPFGINAVKEWMKGEEQ